MFSLFLQLSASLLEKFALLLRKFTDYQSQQAHKQAETHSPVKMAEKLYLKY